MLASPFLFLSLYVMLRVVDTGVDIANHPSANFSWDRWCI